MSDPDRLREYKYPTGAMRERSGVDWASMSWIALRRLAAIYAEGADRYGSNNWRQGLPWSETVNHLMEHLIKWLAGDRSEDHLAKVTWGLFVLMDHEANHPELNDLLEVKPPRKQQHP